MTIPPSLAFSISFSYPPSIPLDQVRSIQSTDYRPGLDTVSQASMVRTKKRARTQSEVWPNGLPSIHWRWKTSFNNNRVFNDHTGKPALMSWRGEWDNLLLPPLVSWVFYMVHPSVPRDFDGCVFQCGLEDGRMVGTGGRYEFFFLPGATVKECHAHYRGEMEARGTIWRQIRKVRRAMNLDKRKIGEQVDDNSPQLEDDHVQAEDDLAQAEDHSTQEPASDPDASADNQLPGLVWPDRDSDCNIGYRGWFFMYPHANIDCRGADGAARDIDVVTFDPIDQEDMWGEDEVRKFDPMKHPVYATRMKVREDCERGVIDWMYLRACSYWESAAAEATDDAFNLGWESW